MNSRKTSLALAAGASQDRSDGESFDWPAGESLDWIATLAEPYLRGYISRLERGAVLQGCRFFAPGSASAPLSRGSSRAPRRSHPVSAGFFAGFLTDSSGLAFLNARPPECVLFCFVEPVGSTFHRRLVQNPESLVRRTAEYIRWLTHRPPRFEFFAGERAALVRHASMREWPRSKHQHLSRNFFVETLAWLVRSALVRRLAAELAVSPAPGSLTRPAGDFRQRAAPPGLRK